MVMVAVRLVPSTTAAEFFRMDELILNDDGGWCWFQDERAIVVGRKLMVGSVATGGKDPSRKGNIEVSTFDLKNGEITRTVLHAGLEADDHAAPALVGLSRSRVLAMYTRHGSDNRICSRLCPDARKAGSWDPEQVFEPSEDSRVTYSNLHWLRRQGWGGKLYNFFRGYDDTYKPSWMVSNDRGRSWKAGGLLIDLPGETARHRPYVKYVSDGNQRVHFAFTEGHPQNFDNSIYHAVIRKGVVCRMDGTPIRPLAKGPIQPSEAVQVYAGNPDNVAWIQDIALDRNGGLRLAFSVQKDSANLPMGSAGRDHRYHWAQYDGRIWWNYEIAYAGSRLYAGEDDYTGGICLHPDDPRIVFISTNVDPVSGIPLPSGHYEIFRGRREEPHSGWQWHPLTPDATEDNLRPIVPAWRRGRTALLWLRGDYRAYTDYDLKVILRVEGGE